MKSLHIHLFIVFLLISTLSFSQKEKEQHRVFSSSSGKVPVWLKYRDNQFALYDIITAEAEKLLELRDDKINRLVTQDDWITYKSQLRGKLFNSLNKFEKTPLNAKVTGILERENFKVEKIIFESHPGFYVTACMFLPNERQNPAPVIVHCSGHSTLAFRSESYQRDILNLVDKGFIVFAFDPIGQGERLQYIDFETGKPNHETGKLKSGVPPSQHIYAGIQTMLTGTSLADYFIWDGVRAIDYLETRPEIDINRIGITGRSGGGTQSAMIAAYDDRILAAAPECYLTNFKRLLHSIGPQDAEQNPYFGISKGFDLPDLLHLHAPKPYLMVTTTNDVFSIHGARDTYSEAQRSYTAYGKTENVQMTEDLGVHESTLKNREAIYAFFQKNLNLPGENTYTEITPFKTEELFVTPSGQLGTSFKGKTVFNLNQEYFSKKDVSQGHLKEIVTEVSGIDFNRRLTDAVYTGKFLINDVGVEKYFIENNYNDFGLPVYVIEKKGNKTEKILLWYHPEGKGKVLEKSFFKDILDMGYTIVAFDLPGTGELFDPDFRGGPFYIFGANLIGKSIPGIQAEALKLTVEFIEQNHRFSQADKVNALIDGTACIPFLHYTSFENSFSKIVFLNPMENNYSLINTEYYNIENAYHVVPGSLQYYDFSDLVSFLPSETFEIINSGKDDLEVKSSKSKILQFFDLSN